MSDEMDLDDQDQTQGEELETLSDRIDNFLMMSDKELQNYRLIRISSLIMTIFGVLVALGGLHYLPSNGVIIIIGLVVVLIGVILLSCFSSAENLLLIYFPIGIYFLAMGYILNNKRRRARSVTFKCTLVVLFYIIIVVAGFRGYIHYLVNR